MMKKIYWSFLLILGFYNHLSANIIHKTVQLVNEIPGLRTTKNAFEDLVLRPTIQTIASNKTFSLIKNSFDNGNALKGVTEFITDKITDCYLKAAESVYRMTAELKDGMVPLDQLYAFLLPTAQEKDAFIRSSIAGGLFATYFFLTLKDKNSSFLRRLYNRLSIIAYGSVVGGSMYLAAK